MMISAIGDAPINHISLHKIVFIIYLEACKNIVRTDISSGIGKDTQKWIKKYVHKDDHHYLSVYVRPLEKESSTEIIE